MTPAPKHHLAAFWAFLTIVTAGNVMLLGALYRHLFVTPSPEGRWLIASFAAEILGAMVFGWRKYFSGQNPLADTQASRSTSKGSQRKNKPAENELDSLIAAAGIKKFIPSRKYYHRIGSSFDDHVRSCRESFTMVSINLMTGLPFEGLQALLLERFKSSHYFKVAISLLNPKRPELMAAMGQNLNVSPAELAASIEDSLVRLRHFREQQLSREQQANFILRAHNVIPFASAIIKDTGTARASLQIETKIYKAPVSSSFAIEFCPGAEAMVYETLLKGYLDLIKDGDDCN